MSWREITRAAELYELHKASPDVRIRINGKDSRVKPLSQDWDLVLAGGTPLIVGLFRLGVWDLEVEES